MSDEWRRSVDPDAPAGVDVHSQGDVEPQTEPRGSGNERTGVAAVDRVLSEIESVSALPVSEHVAVFERAHVALRQALDGTDAPATSATDKAGR